MRKSLIFWPKVSNFFTLYHFPPREKYVFTSPQGRGEKGETTQRAPRNGTHALLRYLELLFFLYRTRQAPT